MGKELNFSSKDVARLLDLVTEVSRQRGLSPSDAIDSLAEFANPACSAQGRVDNFTVELVRRIRQIRTKRNGLVGAELFRDPAWDMLLELFVAHHQSKRLSVSSVCYSSGVPLTTALRQLQRLEDHGLVSREGDHKDNGRCYLAPTPKAIEAGAATTSMRIDHFLALHAEAVARP